MGTPLPPNEDGDLCTVCWGPGKTFGNIPTPRYMRLQLYDLLPGEHWIDSDEQLLLTPYLLMQTEDPCWWFLGVGDYNFQVRYLLGQGASFVRNFATGKSVFENSGDPTCQLSYFDSVGVWANTQAFGGNIILDFDY